MPRVLRVTETAETIPGRYRIELALEGAGPRSTATVPLELTVTAQDREDLRWYLEDYLQFPHDPAPKIAARIEDRLAAIGDTLGHAVLLADRQASRIWDRAREDLANTRVEIITDVRHAASVPWELLRDPETKVPLALEAESFVRQHRLPAKFARGAAGMDTSGGPVRILLVICRPRAGKDVPFRSVAAQLLKGLDEASREVVDLTVLRPPTFDQLTRTLRAAKGRKKPYHIVHFDGHGAYLDAHAKTVADVLSGVNAHVLGGARKGSHGYLVFERAEEAGRENGQLIDGPKLGKLLVETAVPVLVLNACRSAHADPPAEPEKPGATTHAEVESFGSLALEVMDKGVSGVVAMRYNVYVETAKRFVADLYGALAGGLPLGEAVSRGRKQLADNPARAVAYDPVQLQDWSVPVVYEVEPLPLFPAPASKRPVTLSVGGGGAGGSLAGVPQAPDVGFFGRDETLLALDRAFDEHPVVLLHAYAGSGKTSTAAEFARWYVRTGGVEGPVLWTSFEHRMVLSRALDEVGRVFEPELAENRIQWRELAEEKRRRVALQLLQQVPVLWVWDNVEPVAGFPEGTASAWSANEQLVGFLREAGGTKAKFLLTSRRDEQAWLGELPARVKVPAMPMQERVQLARVLASKRRARLEKVRDWKPLLAFADGNPLTITVLVSQALRDGVGTQEEVEALVARLRAGEAAFKDDEKEGRSRSLGASLSYGFGKAFGEEDRKRLALLHLFQGFVDVGTLVVMGDADREWCLPEVRGLTREAGTALLDRVADIGLLTAHGAGRYGIHPAVPWYFGGMFQEHYPEARSERGGSNATDAKRAYVEAMGGLGDFYLRRYAEGHRDMLGTMEAEEPNLLHARVLGRRNGWWRGVTKAMQGLWPLYGHTGRRAEWAKLVQEVTPDFVDPTDDGPLPGREEEWVFLNAYRVRLARESRQWAEAERLQEAGVRLLRERASAVRAVPARALDAGQRNAVRSLGASLHELGEIQRESEQAACITSYSEAAKMARRARDRGAEATVAFSLGHAYKDLATVRDLAKAARWYKRCLEMYDAGQRHDRSDCLAQLGSVAYERFVEARDAKRPKRKLLVFLEAALRSYNEALDLTPPDAVDALAVTHNAIGVIYRHAGDLDRALPHFQDAIRYREQQDNLYDAAGTRLNVALALFSAGRLPDARAYALAALRNYETHGDCAADIRDTRNLLAQIDDHLTPTKAT